MSVSSPVLSGLRCKFISSLGYNGRVTNLFKNPKYTKAITVKTGSDITTDAYIKAPALSGSIGILMTDGDKAFFRSHFVESPETKELADILARGRTSLDTDKPIRALVIGGSDHSSRSQTALDTMKAFFQRNHIPTTFLAPQKQTATSYPKASNLIIKPKKGKVLIAPQNEVTQQNTSLAPLVSDEPSLRAFYRNVDLANGDTLTFVAKDKPFGKKPVQTTVANTDNTGRASN